MKKILLSLVLVAIGIQGRAQCTPNQLYADSVYGVWPDTVENFAPGIVNVLYSDTLNILVPQDAGLIDPTYSGFTIDSVSVDGVDGLPPGISVQCNSQTNGPCSFLTGQVGCGLLEGTPTVEGTYELTLNVTAYTTFLGFVVPVPQTFLGYRIIVAPGNVGVAENVPLSLDQVRAVPNPFDQRTEMQFTLNKPGAVQVSVFNLLGERQWQRTVDGHQGLNTVPFDARGLGSGVYLYKVRVGGNMFTGRMVLDR